MTLNVKNLVIIVVVIAAGYYGYTQFFGGIETTDVAALVDMHRSAPPLKQGRIKERIVKLYQHDQHYQLLLAALDHESPATQALAVAVLTDKQERDVAPQFITMLNDKNRDPKVKEQLARAFRIYASSAATLRAVPRLIELTDEAEAQEVRIAAHDALKEILATNIVRFGAGMRERWGEFWSDHPKRQRP